MNTPFSAQSPMSSFGQMPDFARLVPGFDFLQNLVKGSGAQVPGIGQWVVPTLDPEELTRRIDELRTVQFWLEQNARMIGTTIQALEVQRMTLTTLKGMNVAASDLAEALKIKVPEPQPAAPAPAAAPAATPASAAPASEASPEAAGGADPMLWWNSLTQQFGEIASRTVQSIQEAAATAAAAVPEPVVVKSAKRSSKATAPASPGKAATASKPAPTAPARKTAVAKKAPTKRAKAG
jgi:hypothetical protein